MYRKNSANINELINRFELSDDFVNENVKYVKVGKEKEKFLAFSGSEMDRTVMKFKNDDEFSKKKGRSWSARKMTQQKIANVLSRLSGFLDMLSKFPLPRMSTMSVGLISLFAIFVSPRSVVEKFLYPGFRLLFCIIYPGYSSFKAIRTKNVKEYVRNMMFWVVFAFLTCFEMLFDAFISWFPFYFEIKVIFLIWLQGQTTRGSSTIYKGFIHPMLTRREKEIDEMIYVAQEQGYTAVLKLGSKSVDYATNVIMQTTPIRDPHTAIMLNKRAKNYGLCDLSETDDTIRSTEDEIDELLRLKKLALQNEYYNSEDDSFRDRRGSLNYDNYSSGYSSPIPVHMKSRIYIEDGPNLVNNFNYPYATPANIQEIRKSQKVQEEISRRKWSINELNEEEIILAYNKLNNKDFKDNKVKIEKLDAPEEFSSKAQDEKLEKYEMFLKWMEQKNAGSKDTSEKVITEINKEINVEVTIPSPKDKINVSILNTDKDSTKDELTQDILKAMSKDETTFEDFKDTVSVSSDDEFLEPEDFDEVPLNIKDDKVPLEETTQNVEQDFEEEIVPEIKIVGEIEKIEKVIKEENLPVMQTIKIVEPNPTIKALSNPILDLLTKPISSNVASQEIKTLNNRKTEDPINGIEQEKAIISSIKSSLENIEKIMIEAKFTLTDSPLEIKSSITNLSSSSSSLTSDNSSASAESIIKAKPSHSKGRAPPPPILSVLNKPYEQTTSEKSPGCDF